MKVLLSIKPVFIERIFSGSKRYEFRKSLYKTRDVSTVVIYATRPVCRIVGEFDVVSIISGTPSEVWKKTSDFAGISKIFFDEYFDGYSKGYALEVGDLRIFDDPIDPNLRIDGFAAPQSYMYLNDDLGRMPSDQFSLAI